MIVLPNCSQDAAGTVLKRICEHVPGGQTCSVGIASWDGEEPPEQLVARADAALYQAKHEGRDRIVNAAQQALTTQAG